MPQTHLFEMRRLEMLSNTIFGVAMTLLAYDLPKASSFTQAPTWMGLVHVYAQPVIALTISFIVAGLFWFSHHRRLAVAPEGGRGVVFLNLFFLLAIIILPVTNGLYGVYRLDGVIAVLYGFHLTVIAALNALLWVLALRGRYDPQLLATALVPVVVFVIGTTRPLSRRKRHSSSGAWRSWHHWAGGSRHVARVRAWTQDNVTLSRNGCQEIASLLALSNCPSSKSLPTHLKYSQRNDASGNWYTCSSGTHK